MLIIPDTAINQLHAPVQVQLAGNLGSGGISHNISQRTILGYSLGSVAGMGRRENRLCSQLIGKLYAGMSDSVRNMLLLLYAGVGKTLLIVNGALSLHGNLAHGLHSLHRIVTTGGLTAEHDGISAIKYGIGYVRNLSTGRTRIVGHGLQHLGGHDNQLASPVALADDFLLQERHILRRNLYTQIATGYHDAVSSLDDCINILYALQVLDLGNNSHIALVLLDKLPDFLYIAGALNKGSSHIIHIILDAEDNILLILLGNRWQAYGYARSCYALLGAHRAAVQDLRHDILALDFLYGQAYQAIRQQDGVARLYFLVQCLVADRGMMLITRGICIGQDELLALGQLNLAVLERAQAHLRPLGVKQQCHDAIGMACRIANHLDAACMLRVISVGEIKAGTVHAILNQFFNQSRFFSSRSHGTYDFSLL